MRRPRASPLNALTPAEREQVLIAVAQERFAGAVPEAKKVRDVLEHLEDYELGVGDLQKPWDGSKTLGIMYQRAADTTGWRDTLHLQGVGLSLDFRATHEAVAALLSDSMEALDRLRAEVEREHGPWRPPPRLDLVP